MTEDYRFADHTEDRLASLDPGSIPDDLDLVIEQRILDGDAVVERYAVALQNGLAEIASDDRASDIVISQDLETARSIQSGASSAQTAYLTGRLTIDGDVDKLLATGPALQSVLAEIAPRP